MNHVSHANELATSEFIVVTTNAPLVSNGHQVIHRADVLLTAFIRDSLPIIPHPLPILHLSLPLCLYALVTGEPTHFVVALLGSTVQLLVVAPDLSPTMTIST